jgi:hypothetical protein
LIGRRRVVAIGCFLYSKGKVGTRNCARDLRALQAPEHQLDCPLLAGSGEELQGHDVADRIGGEVADHSWRSVEILQHAECIVLPQPVLTSANVSGKPSPWRALPIVASGRCLLAEQINGIITKARKVGV